MIPSLFHGNFRWHHSLLCFLTPPPFLQILHRPSFPLHPPPPQGPEATVNTYIQTIYTNIYFSTWFEECIHIGCMRRNCNSSCWIRSEERRVGKERIMS